ncbi:MAG: hypothetical protein ACLU9S_00275 [Oscillospiraceae bacterium]
MGLIILGNHWSGVLFTVDEAGRYLRGPLYMGMYVFAGAYILLIAGNSMFCARRRGKTGNAHHLGTAVPRRWMCGAPGRVP